MIIRSSTMRVRLRRTRFFQSFPKRWWSPLKEGETLHIFFEILNANRYPCMVCHKVEAHRDLLHDGVRPHWAIRRVEAAFQICDAWHALHQIDPTMVNSDGSLTSAAYNFIENDDDGRLHVMKLDWWADDYEVRPLAFPFCKFCTDDFIKFYDHTNGRQIGGMAFAWLRNRIRGRDGPTMKNRIKYGGA